jgi:hypothetical protein
MSINLGLPSAPEVDSPELYGALMPVYNAIKNTMYAVDAYTGNSLINEEEYSEVNAYGQLLLQKTAVLFVKLTETVLAGHMINLWNSGGLRARKATGGSNRAHGFAAAGGSAGDTIPVSLFGLCTLIGGLTPGTEYYLSGSAGQITTSASYHRVGMAVGPNHLWFSPS